MYRLFEGREETYGTRTERITMVLDKREVLSEIFGDDPDDILAVKITETQRTTEQDRLLSSFEEVLGFVDTHGRIPEKGKNMQERRLANHIEAFNSNPEQVAFLQAYDRHRVLKGQKEIEDLDDIFGDDDFGFFEDSEDTSDIFDFNHTPKEIERPDYVARRKACDHFDAFEDILRQCQVDLKLGKRQIRKFRKESQIRKGNFFVLKGVLLYVAHVGKLEKSEDGKKNARLLCVFENGTESDMMLRSLSSSLYKDGFRISEHQDQYMNIRGSAVGVDDEATGYIYVLRSLKQEPSVQRIKNLFKIGFSTKPTQDRIRNAERESTYLYGPVSIVGEWKCFNMNVQKFESLLHRIFSESRLDIEMTAPNGDC
ncbi:GIY-YIG nuclease family protein, partial [Prolixibacteraceae bacterium]|nr:GIY-YIG nuclease family protein [Prolixibacteraceae bacterium]